MADCADSSLAEPSPVSCLALRFLPFAVLVNPSGNQFHPDNPLNPISDSRPSSLSTSVRFGRDGTAMTKIALLHNGAYVYYFLVRSICVE